MARKKFSLASLSFKLPVYLLIFCIILSVTNGFISYRVFKSLFERQYRDITEQICETALSYIDAEKIPEYAAGAPADEAWFESDKMLDMLTVTQKLAYIYVTIPDENYESRVYIYDTVHPDIKNGTKYQLGWVNTLKNYDEDYIQNLKNVMIDGEPYIRFVYRDTGGHVTTSIPVKDKNGKNIAIMSIVKPMSEIKEFTHSYRLNVGLSSSIITFVFLLIIIGVLMGRFVKPMTIITHETSHFAEHKGHLSDKLTTIKGKDELGVLARSVEKMSVDMNQYINELTKTTAEKERLSAELNVATQIQANMLPRIFPPYKEHPELVLYATMEPAKEVGGDFYDFFMIDDNHFAIVVGDVSGKGVPAALFMVIAKTLIKSSILLGLSPSQVFEKVNNELCECNDSGLFVTCWMGILSIKERELCFVNAGHNPPILSHAGNVDYIKTQANLMLAGLDGTKYTEHKIKLDKEDLLFVYTDGVTEATDANNQMYGEERLLEFLKNNKTNDVKESLSLVRQDIDTFVNGIDQFDDITMLELYLKG